jgi:hypothetical protein
LTDVNEDVVQNNQNCCLRAFGIMVMRDYASESQIQGARASPSCNASRSREGKIFYDDEDPENILSRAGQLVKDNGGRVVAWLLINRIF